MLGAGIAGVAWIVVLAAAAMLAAVVVAASTAAVLPVVFATAPAIAAFTALASAAVFATSVIVATGRLFAPISLSVSWCRQPSCRAQGGYCRDEGWFHVEAPVCSLHILASMTMMAFA